MSSFISYHGISHTPPDFEEPSINVPLLVGLLSGVGTLLLGLLCAVIWFAIIGQGRIRLGNGEPGDYDDEQEFLEQEAEALEHMDDLSRQSYYQAKAFVEANPPNSANTDISLSQFMNIQEKGVSAWEFEPEFPNANCFVESRTEIEFFDSICCVQTNLPLPKQNDVYYWEVKIYDKPVDTVLSIGFSTKPYPTFRLPGYHRHSIAYDSTGVKRHNQPFKAPHYGPPLQPGDVVGVGYRTRSGTVFFTRNGKKLEDAVHGMRLNLFPTIGSTGPATTVVNFGQAGFVYIEANVKKWGLAPVHGSLAPPPPYGAENEFVLLESGHQTPDVNPPPIDQNDQDQEGEPSTSQMHLLDESTSTTPTLPDSHQDGINLTTINRHHTPVASSPPPSYAEVEDGHEDSENDENDEEEHS